MTELEKVEEQNEGDQADLTASPQKLFHKTIYRHCGSGTLSVNREEGGNHELIWRAHPEFRGGKEQGQVI
ncbi:hypothetical protein SRHO_G00210530 [Serrasalmus rhombeus]